MQRDAHRSDDVAVAAADERTGAGGVDEIRRIDADVAECLAHQAGIRDEERAERVDRDPRGIIELRLRRIDAEASDLRRYLRARKRRVLADLIIRIARDVDVVGGVERDAVRSETIAAERNDRRDIAGRSRSINVDEIDREIRDAKRLPAPSTAYVLAVASRVSPRHRRSY